MTRYKSQYGLLIPPSRYQHNQIVWLVELDAKKDKHQLIDPEHYHRKIPMGEENMHR